MAKQSRKAKVLGVCFGVVASFEGLRLDPYSDSKGIKTVCYGETNGIVQKHYSKDECDEMLNRDLGVLVAKLTNDVHRKLSDNQTAALVSFIYNVGWGSWLKSQVRRDVIAMRDKLVPNDLKKWSYVCAERPNKKKVCNPILLNRRTKEGELYLTPDADEKPSLWTTIVNAFTLIWRELFPTTAQ